MVRIEEKLKYNVMVMIFTVVGLLVVEVILMLLWFAVLVPANSYAGNGLAANFDLVRVPVAFTIFFAYLFGATVRGLEKKSHGLDIHNMDRAELEVEIALLQKEITRQDMKDATAREEENDAKKFAEKRFRSK